MSALPEFVRVRPGRGWDWLVLSHGMFAKARLHWLLLIVGYTAISMMISVVPVIGLVAATLLKPVFAVGFLAAAWAQERGDPPMLKRLFAGFRSNIRALLPLGVVYGAGVALALVMSSASDGGTLMRWFLLGERPEGVDPMQTPGIQSAIVMAMLCSVPTIFALWFAPALIVFQDQSTVAALVQSFRAAISNLAAVIVYAMSVFIFWVVIPGLIISTCVVLFPGRTGLSIGLLLSMPFTLSVIAIIFIADYVVYRDLFHHQEGLASRAAPRG